MRICANFAAGWAAMLALCGCYGVMGEDLESPQEADPVASVEIFEVPELDPLDPDRPPAEAGVVGELLVRLQIQPTAWGTEHAFVAQDAGRWPQLSLYADGTLIWASDDGLRISSVSRQRAREVHNRLVARGLGSIASYEKATRPSEGAMCLSAGKAKPCKPGGRLTMQDVGIEIWDVAIPGQGLTRSKHYAGWAPGRDDDLRAVRASLHELAVEASDESTTYRPVAASLLLLATDWNPDAETWPLHPELFETTVRQHEVVVELDGDDLETMSLSMPGYRRTHFVRDGKLIEATLVPWLPDQDWTEAIASFEPRSR